MVTEMITLKLEDKFLKEIDRIAKENHYHNRTEFIRNALRDQLEYAVMKKYFKALRGDAKPTTKVEYERARTEAFYELKNSKKPFRFPI